jgi:hypothetical protein
MLRYCRLARALKDASAKFANSKLMLGELASLFLDLRPQGFTHEDLQSRRRSALAHKASGKTSPLSVMFQ